jgi:type I restriction enzyme R subunit
MVSQPEHSLERKLIEQLIELGHASITLKDEEAILANLQSQLEQFNNTTFTDREFTKPSIT